MTDLQPAPTRRSLLGMIGMVAGCMGEFEERRVEALVNEQFCHYRFSERGCWATPTAFCFAHGRRAGRPRRGKAAT